MSNIRAGMDAPKFALPGMTGKTESLEGALKKGPVLAAFFKISCPVCQLTLPFLERMRETYGDGSVTFWGISQDNVHDTQEFNEEYGVKFPSLIDADGYKATRLYGLTNVPSTFLIQPDGKVQTASIGFSKKDLEMIATEVAIASGKPAQPLFKPNENVPAYKPG